MNDAMEICSKCSKPYAHSCDDRQRSERREKSLEEVIEAGPLLQWGTFFAFHMDERMSLDEAIESGLVVSREFVAEHPEAGEVT